jgi:hypothetical protein
VGEALALATLKDAAIDGLTRTARTLITGGADVTFVRCRTIAPARAQLEPTRAWTLPVYLAREAILGRIVVAVVVVVARFLRSLVRLLLPVGLVRKNALPVFVIVLFIVVIVLWRFQRRGGA